MEPIAAAPPLAMPPPNPGMAAGTGWTTMLDTAAAVMAALGPAQLDGGAAGAERMVASDGVNAGIIAAAQAAAQITMTMLPMPTAAAVPAQASDSAEVCAKAGAKAGEWMRAYAATYNAWLAVLLRHRGPAPAQAPTILPAGWGRPLQADHIGRPRRDRHARASLLAHALTLWTQNVTATFSALPAFVQPAPGDAEAAQRLRQLAARAVPRPAPPVAGQAPTQTPGLNSAGGAT